MMLAFFLLIEIVSTAIKTHTMMALCIRFGSEVMHFAKIGALI